MLETLLTVAQLASLLLVPGVVWAVRLTTHVKMTSAFMVKAETRLGTIEAKQATMHTDLEILKDRAERQPACPVAT